MLEAIVIEAHTHTPSASVIWMHGLGADGHDFADIVPQLQLPDTLPVRFIFPHAPFRPITINQGFKMRAWYDIVSLRDLEQEDRIGIQNSQRHIEQLIAQEKRAGIPASRIVLAGFSQGGALALYTGLHYPESLAGMMGLSTYLPLAQELSAVCRAAHPKTPIFLAHGTQDAMVSPDLGEKTRKVLQQAGYPVEWHTYPMAHQVCASEIQDIRKWLIHLLAANTPS